MSDSSSQDEDFDGFTDAVGQSTITPDEDHLIKQAINTYCPSGAFAALMRWAYFNICEKQLKKRKIKEPKFMATTIIIDTKSHKVIIS